MKKSTLYFIIFFFLLASGGSFLFLLNKQVFTNPLVDLTPSPISSLTPAPMPSVSTSPLTAPVVATYTVSYVTKPSVMFGDATSEIILFEATMPVRAQIYYGLTPEYGQIINVDNSKSIHEITISELTPDTKYYYRVVIFTDNGGKNDTETGSFVTKPALERPFSFVFLGDSRPAAGVIQPQTYINIINKLVETSPDLVVMGGDLVQLEGIENVNRQHVLEAWRYFHLAVHPLTGNIPMLPVAGNHDKPDEKLALKRWQEVWAMPRYTGKSTWLDETAYSVEYSNSLFVIFNSEEPGYAGDISKEQFAWLEKTLKRSQDYRYTFVFDHRPVRGSKRATYGHALELHKLFLDNHVTAVFSGHDHLYCHTAYDGLHYFTSGGAGSPLYKDFCLGKEISQYHYLWVNVTPSNLTVKALDLDGKILDSVKVLP